MSRRTCCLHLQDRNEDGVRRLLRNICNQLPDSTAIAPDPYLLRHIITFSVHLTGLWARRSSFLFPVGAIDVCLLQGFQDICGFQPTFYLVGLYAYL